MKYDSLKKAHAKLSYNRYVFYEPKFERPKAEDGGGLLYSLAIRFFVCGFIFLLLLTFSKIPALDNVVRAVKSYASYNMKIFKIEEAGTIPIIEKINSLIPDNSPLKLEAPLKTPNIIMEGDKARLKLDQNPLVYSSEKGVVTNISRTGEIATIEIKHRNNTVTKYAGLGFCGVQAGQTVEKGFPIGVLAGDELVFVVYENGKQTSIQDKTQWD